MNNLSDFLIKAKKETYASKNQKKVMSSRLNSTDFEYKLNNYLYHDTYFGGKNFIGSEVVYNEGIPIWGMNYYGITLDEELMEGVYDLVLKPALMKVCSDDTIPVRGPKEFIVGDFRYTFLVSGILDNFAGVETIYKNDKKIYILKCHGGIIK